MSSRMKKLRNKMGRQVIDGKISVAEARARLGQGGRFPAGRPGAAVAKATVPGPGGVSKALRRYQQEQMIPLAGRAAGGVPASMRAALDSLNPQIRAQAEAAMEDWLGKGTR